MSNSLNEEASQSEWIFAFLKSCNVGQAKENSSKYTGVSSEESRMGGFGSSNSGFGSSSTAMGGGSALSRVELGSNKNSSLAAFGSNDSFRSSRYDDDLDSGHHALSADDVDEDMEARSYPHKSHL